MARLVVPSFSFHGLDIRLLNTEEDNQKEIAFSIVNVQSKKDFEKIKSFENEISGLSNVKVRFFKRKVDFCLDAVSLSHSFIGFGKNTQTSSTVSVNPIHLLSFLLQKVTLAN